MSDLDLDAITVATVATAHPDEISEARQHDCRI